LRYFCLVVFVKIILLSSLISCCPEAQACDAIEKSSCANETKDEPIKDLPCSPFFECGSCPGIISIEISFYIESPQITYAKCIFPYTEKFLLSEFHSKLLRPPMSLI